MIHLFDVLLLSKHHLNIVAVDELGWELRDAFVGTSLQNVKRQLERFEAAGGVGTGGIDFSIEDTLDALTFAC